MLYWQYLNYPIAQAETEFGFYSILADEDRLGEPLFLSYHSTKDNYCEVGETIISDSDKYFELEELQDLALKHYQKLSEEVYSDGLSSNQI